MDRWWSGDHTTGVISVVAFLGFMGIIFGTITYMTVTEAPYEDAINICSKSSQPTDFCTKLIDKLSVEKGR